MAALASDRLRHLWLLLDNRWTEFNETWQEARSQRPLPSLCFRASRKNKMATLAESSSALLWSRVVRRPSVVNFSHFRLLLWNRWTEFNETWQEARFQHPLPSLYFSGQSEKQDGFLADSSKKVAHCTQVHDMWPFGPLDWWTLSKAFSKYMKHVYRLEFHSMIYNRMYEYMFCSSPVHSKTCLFWSKLLVNFLPGSSHNVLCHILRSCWYEY